MKRLSSRPATASNELMVVDNMNAVFSPNSTNFLPPSFVPSNFDVILGRKKKWQSHAGNHRLRLIVAANLEAYKAAQTRSEKTRILSSIVEQVRKFNPKGSFVKLDDSTGLWFDVGNVLAREKVSQTFRDALCDTYKSSNEYKRKKRQEEGEKKNIGASSILLNKNTSNNNNWNPMISVPKSQYVTVEKIQPLTEGNKLGNDFSSSRRNSLFLADPFVNIESSLAEPNSSKVSTNYVEDSSPCENDPNLIAFLQDINFLENWDAPDHCESNRVINGRLVSSNGCSNGAEMVLSL